MTRLQTLIHVAKKELKLTDEHYRLVLRSVTGKTSTSEMSYGEQQQVLDAFKAKGFVVASKKVNPKNVTPINPEVVVPRRLPHQNDPRLGKIWKLWYILQAHNETNGSAKALNAFIKRQTGLEKMEWLTRQDEFDAVIEALKDWCLRKDIRLNI